MKVTELIEILSKVDPNLHVVLCVNPVDMEPGEDRDLVNMYLHPDTIVLADETVVDSVGGKLLWL